MTAGRLKAKDIAPVVGEELGAINSFLIRKIQNANITQ
jgi:hypothetical protein